jgi:hypothetical protein
MSEKGGEGGALSFSNQPLCLNQLALYAYRFEQIVFSVHKFVVIFGNNFLLQKAIITRVGMHSQILFLKSNRLEIYWIFSSVRGV